MPPETERRVIAGLLAGLLSGFVVFALWPGLDIVVSGAFFDASARTFMLKGVPWAEAVRKAIWGASSVILMMALAGLVTALALRRPTAGLPARAWGFIVAVYALGPGLVVEALLKSHWGRARPSDIAEFGGRAAFTPPWLPTDQCAKNCAFVAGETAGAVALAISLVVILAWTGPRLPGWLRAGLVAVAVGAPVIASLHRLAAGRHFLSDILAAALLVGLIAAVLGRFLRPLPRAVDNHPDSP